MSKAHTARAHAKLSPSGGYRWSACPGSARLSADIPNKSSIYAGEGSAAHQLGELCLRNNVDAVDFLGGHVDIKQGTVGRDEKSGNGIFGIDEEMAEGVQVYVDTVRGMIAEGDEFEFEAKLDLTHIDGMEFGTGDFLRYRPNTKELVIVDLKYGKGKVVEVTDNVQLLIYAEGTAKRFHNRGLDKVRIVIVQPRAPHKDGPVREQVIDALDLVEFRFKLVDWAKATLVPDAPLVAGDHCKFCPAAPTCPALRGLALRSAEMEFGELEPPKISEMSAEDKADILRAADVIEGWCKRVKESAHADALEGNGPPGFKLVESTSHRKMRETAELDEKTTVDVTPKYLAKTLKLDVDDLMVDPKMKSPAQIEKLLGAKRKVELAPYTWKPRGKIILVPDSDPRSPVKADAAMEFAE